jgi:hypothetical protein
MLVELFQRCIPALSSAIAHALSASISFLHFLC